MREHLTDRGALTAGDRVRAAVLSVGLLTLVLLLSACADPIQISPVYPQAAAGTSLQLSATIDNHGTPEDVTSQVSWSSSDTGVATVGTSSGNAGAVSGVTAGKATISAKL